MRYQKSIDPAGKTTFHLSKMVSLRLVSFKIARIKSVTLGIFLMFKWKRAHMPLSIPTPVKFSHFQTFFFANLKVLEVTKDSF